MVSGANGTIINTDAGYYSWLWSAAFTGSTNTQYTIRHLTNDVPSFAQSIRSIGGSPMVGSMSGLGGGYLPAGVTNRWQVTSDMDGSYISIVNGSAVVRKEAN